MDAGGGYSPIQTLRSRSGATVEDTDTAADTGKGRSKERVSLPLAVHLANLRASLASLASHRVAPVLGATAVIALLTFVLVHTSGDSQHSLARRNIVSTSTELCSGEKDGEKLRPFIFIYDFEGKYTKAVRKNTPAWYSEVYNAELTFLEYVEGNSAIRTWNPEEALLFYVPFYAAFFLSCQFKDWENNMREAVMKTSEAWEAVLNTIRAQYPYFNRTNGADHFSVLSMDYGRCQSLTYVEPRLYGDMFFLQANGDKMLRSTHTHIRRNMQVLSYNYGAHGASDIPDIPCYRPDLDIVYPPTLEDSTKHPMGITSPSQGERTLTAVFRFKTVHHHKQAVTHNNHRIRMELYQLFRGKGLEGWEFGIREPEKILREDMQKSVFCVCPPGHSIWTTRVTKSILSGCIPVTFFRDQDNPWQDEIDYSSFTVNVDPDDITTLHTRLENILRNPRRLLSLQRNLERVQRLFLWSETDPLGVQAHLARTLWCRAKKLDRGMVGSLRREARLAQRGIRTLPAKIGGTLPAKIGVKHPKPRR